MTGDADDILSRIRRGLPPWFGRDGDAPALDALLSGVAALLAWFYGLYQFTRAQTRVATSTGGWLDLSAGDVAGGDLPRFSGETDAAYARRIRLEPLRDRNTIPAIRKAVFDITGIEPDVYEGFDTFGNGAFGASNLALSRAGRWSSTQLAFVVLVTVYMHNNYGIPNRGGFDDGAGGLGDGNFSWADASEIIGSGATQDDVLAALERVRAAGVTIYATFATFGAPEAPLNNVPA